MNASDKILYSFNKNANQRIEIGVEYGKYDDPRLAVKTISKYKGDYSLWLQPDALEDLEKGIYCYDLFASDNQATADESIEEEIHRFYFGSGEKGEVVISAVPQKRYWSFNINVFWNGYPNYRNQVQVPFRSIKDFKLGIEKFREYLHGPDSKKQYHVYVIELDDVILCNKRFLSRNSDYQQGRPCVYVGQTGKTPYERFQDHQNGNHSNRFAKEYGVKLLPDLYESYNPMPTRKMAEEREEKLVHNLKQQGYAVWSDKE